MSSPKIQYKIDSSLFKLILFYIFMILSRTVSKRHTCSRIAGDVYFGVYAGLLPESVVEI